MNSDSHTLIIISIGIPSSFLSLLSTSFVFLLYIFNPELHCFPFRLVVYLQISDFIMSFGQFMNIFMSTFKAETNNIRDSFLCQMQAYFCQYGALSTIIWAIIITSLMVLSMNRNICLIEALEKKLIFLGFYIPGILSIMYYFPNHKTFY